MEPLGGTASVVALLQLASFIIKYLTGIKNSSGDIRRMIIELSTIRGLLETIKDVVGDNSSLLGFLQGPEGIFAQTEAWLESLALKIGAQPPNGKIKLGKILRWPLQKDDIKEILSSVERQKSLLSLALQHDQM